MLTSERLQHLVKWIEENLEREIEAKDRESGSLVYEFYRPTEEEIKV